MTLCVIQGGYCDEKLDAGHCYGSIGEGMWEKEVLKPFLRITWKKIV